MGKGDASRKMVFVGVTTGRSAIVPLFPRWVAALGLEGTTLAGRDVPLRAGRAAYRRVVEDMLADPAVCGALVTTHKVDVLEAAGDLLDELDPLARLCGEVSCIARRDGRAVGLGRDPVTAGRALDDLLGAGAPVPAVLCLGAGGAGCALAVHVARRPGRATLTLVDRDEDRLRSAGRVLERLGEARAGIDVALAAGADEATRLVEAMPPGSLIVNATGMGKDVPGSPVRDGCRFPESAIAWDYNYRGDLRFLRQATARADAGVRPVDGWDYFLHGWSDCMAEVLGFEWTPGLFARLRALAGPVRP